MKYLHCIFALGLAYTLFFGQGYNKSIGVKMWVYMWMGVTVVAHLQKD